MVDISVDDIIVDIQVKLDDLDRGLRQAESKVAQAASRMAGGTGFAGSAIARRLAGPALAVGAATAIARSTGGELLERLERRGGTPLGRLQAALDFAGPRAGVLDPNRRFADEALPGTARGRIAESLVGLIPGGERFIGAISGATSLTRQAEIDIAGEQARLARAQVDAQRQRALSDQTIENQRRLALALAPERSLDLQRGFALQDVGERRRRRITQSGGRPGEISQINRLAALETATINLETERAFERLNVVQAVQTAGGIAKFGVAPTAGTDTTGDILKRIEELVAQISQRTSEAGLE